MTNVTIELVKRLRDCTGVGIMECKRALIDAKGDIEQAITNIRKSGHINLIRKKKIVKIEGIILINISQNARYGVIVELNCETDFVAKSNEFKTFGNEITNAALNEHITDLNILQIKFEDQLSLMIAKFGENISIGRLSILEGNTLSYYMHNNLRIGVIVSVNGTDKYLIKHIAMHIAASKPKYIDINDIPIDVITHERQIQLSIAMKFNKSHKVIEKIVEGRMNKFFSNISLKEQYFILDPSKTVGQLLNEYNIQVNNFVRFEIGEI